MTAEFDGPRVFTRSVLRAHAEALKAKQAFEAVRARVSPELGALLDRPRDAPPWVAGRMFDELDEIVFSLYGREGLRDLLRRVMASGIARILEPMLQFSLTFFGGTPAALFSRADSMLSINARNLRVSWQASSPAGGTVRLRSGDPAPGAHWIAWEGVTAYLLHLAGAEGIVGEARPGDDGRGCEIDVSWTTT